MAYVMLHGEATLDLLEIAPRELQFRQVPGLAGDFLQLQGKFMLVSDEPQPQVCLGFCSSVDVIVCTYRHTCAPSCNCADKEMKHVINSDCCCCCCFICFCSCNQADVVLVVCHRSQRQRA